MALRCLIIDDNEEFLASAQTLLSAQGLEVAGVASTGVEALRLAEELRVNVALVDVQLGEENGLDLARQLSASVPGTQIVLISTHSSDDLDALMEGVAVAGFLTKTALSAAAIAELVDQRASR